MYRRTLYPDWHWISELRKSKSNNKFGIETFIIRHLVQTLFIEAYLFIDYNFCQRLKAFTLNIYPWTERVRFNWEELCSFSSFIRKRKFGKDSFNKHHTVSDTKIKTVMPWSEWYKNSWLSSTIFCYICYIKFPVNSHYWSPCFSFKVIIENFVDHNANQGRLPCRLLINSQRERESR